MTIDSMPSEAAEGQGRLAENPSLNEAPEQCQATSSVSNNNVNNIRKTLAKWLRLQKRSPESSQSPRPRPRYKLTGWPPKWVRRRSHSPVANRALPPVPQSQELDHDPDRDQDHQRVSTPELQPEDFPPGVAYLPEGEEDDVNVFESKSSDEIIDFAASIETVKNVRKILEILFDPFKILLNSCKFWVFTV